MSHSPDATTSPVGRPVLLVGRRKAAVAAAERLGLAPIVIDLKAAVADPSLAGLPLHERALAQAAAALAGRAPAAVVATGEGAVPTAAILRTRYGLPGLDPATAAICTDKKSMKRAARAAGVPCAAAEQVDGFDAGGAEATADRLIAALGLPLVLKVPVSSGGRGVRILRDRAGVVAALAPPMLAEAFVTGTEMSVETISCAGVTLLRNHTRYVVPGWANVVPANLDPETAAAVDEVVDAALVALGARHGMSHLELFLTDGGPVFSEAAVRPPGGHIMELIERAYGVNPWEVVIRIELGEVPEPLPPAARHAGVWFLHPGAGTITSVSGKAAARSAPGVVRVRCTAKRGKRLDERIGTGQSTGEVVVVADDHDTCVAQLRAARERIVIKVESA